MDIINTENASKRRFTILSLFSGCGGLDLGFKGGFTYLHGNYERNNFDIIWANEINSQAVETYRSYFGNHIVCEDINNIRDDEFPQADIIIGGFPCQDFSLAGKKQGLNVERGRLYLQMKRAIDAVKPVAFIAENVRNLMVMGNGVVLKTIIDDFKQSGYNVYFHLYNAANYGVPQNRERVIIYGIREDLNNIPFIPLETHSLYNWVTASEAIDDLWDKLDTNIPNHSRRDYSKAKFYEGKRTQGNIRIQSDKVAPTIRAEHHGNIEGHYRTYGDESDLSNWRRLSVRECARIQTFPDDFIFQSAASSAYKQVGNAVPPVLAWNIARALFLSLIRIK
ncbi:cytosine methyltransferase [Clostridium pasteurianum DSM 525 = ATCC 6013]|nr:cytosine methyltransferase [Clostridium pasteurianum DSM 525 = ATCC 6013]AOZ81063.1 cytosine methyltransferase [Clostridium pasteurianum]